MSKFLRALELGMEILTDFEQLVSGQSTSFTFTWKGKAYTVTVTPNP